MEVTAAVSNHPTNQWEQVDLVLYYDDSNMVKVGLELVDGQLSIVMGREEKRCDAHDLHHAVASDDVELRYQVDAARSAGSSKLRRAMARSRALRSSWLRARRAMSLQFYQGPADAEHWGACRR